MNASPPAQASVGVVDSQELTRLEFLRTEFLDRIAHELRGPAGVTLGALDELELSLGADAAGHRSLLAMARRGALRVLRTADRLTRAAQLEAGSIAFNRVPTDLRQLVQRACTQATLLEGRGQVSVALVGLDDGCTASVDQAWLQAAVTELIALALRLARSEVRVELTSDSSQGARLVVSNDGASVELLGRRFESRADRRDTGLALPLVVQVADALGATVSVESQGSGMSISMTFARD